MTCPAWTGLQIVIDILIDRHRAAEPLDVRDPLIDLTTCPRCGSDLSEHATA